jgi:hypothetical protein
MRLFVEAQLARKREHVGWAVVDMLMPLKNSKAGGGTGLIDLRQEV